VPNAFAVFNCGDNGDGVSFVNANGAFYGLVESNEYEAAGLAFEILFKMMRPEWFRFVLTALSADGSKEYDCSSADGIRHLKTHVVKFASNLFALIIVDITEVRRYNDQIKFQAFLLDNINCAIGATDYNGRYIYWNKHMETLFQWKKEEIIGRHMLEIRLTEDMKVNDSIVFERIQKDGYMEFDTNCPRKDKTSFPAHVIVASLKDENGNIMALVGIHTDISEHKKLEAALKESNERWQYALEGSGDGIWDYNIQTRKVYFSPHWKKLLLYEENEIGDELCDWLKLIHPDDKKTFDQNLLQHLGGVCDQFVCEHRIKCADGLYKWFLARAKIIVYSEDKRPLRLIGTLSDISSIKSMEREVFQTKKKLLEKYTFNDIVGQSPQIMKLVNILPTVAQSDCNILIEGPSGTGKNLIAKAIYNISARSASPFHIINCGALPETLLESELFGYVKGAFTDAKKDKPGKFALADGGIVFLDEIAELPQATQAKLLHFIEDKIFTPLGGTRTLKADVRIIAATNRDLLALIREKKFRDDLYYRLKIVNVKVPPLKERLEDIELLLQRFMDELNLKYSKNITMISQNAYEFLMVYDYPGNVRELRNMLEHAFIFCHDNVLKPENFPEDYQKKIMETLAPGGPSESKKRGQNFIDAEYLKKTLKKNGFNRNRTAAELAVSRITLWRLMKKYEII
jgi:PAS domain S-box-containing protein